MNHCDESCDFILSWASASSQSCVKPSLQQGNAGKNAQSISFNWVCGGIGIWEICAMHIRPAVQLPRTLNEVWINCEVWNHPDLAIGSALFISVRSRLVPEIQQIKCHQPGVKAHWPSQHAMRQWLCFWELRWLCLEPSMDDCIVFVSLRSVELKHFHKHRRTTK